MGQPVLPDGNQPVYRLFLLLQRSGLGWDCEDEPGAITFALPGHLCGALAPWRRSGWNSDCWRLSHHCHRGGRSKKCVSRKANEGGLGEYRAGRRTLKFPDRRKRRVFEQKETKETKRDRDRII